MLSGDDVMVYPLHDDVVYFDLKFFNKIKGLKFTSSVETYVASGLPIIVSSRLGGGFTKVWFLVAPREKDE